MPWSADLIVRLPKDLLLNSISELLGRMGFKNYEKVSNESEWGADIVAIREDPIAGTEKLILLVHDRGLASSKDVNVFAQSIERHKAHKGVLVSPAGFTKDAKLLISQDYLGRIIPWDGEKLASLLNNYSVNVPEGAEKFFTPEKEEKEETLEEFELDAPLLYDFSHAELMKRVSEHLTRNYPVSPDEIELVSLSLELSTAYIVSWELTGAEKESGKAIIFSKDDVVLNAEEDRELSTPLKKALLDGRAVIRATERRIQNPVSPGEVALILKGLVAEKRGVSENHVSITDRRKVYLPVMALMELRIGENRGEVRVNLRTGGIDVSLEPLPQEYFLEKARDIVEKETGEKPEEINVKTGEKKLKVLGRTRRFSFEVIFNPYTGKLVGLETLMSDEALEELLKSLYPSGKVLSLEKTKKEAVADLLVEGGIVVVGVNLRNGEAREVRSLPSPAEAFERAKKFVEGNFPVSGLEPREYRVIEHKCLEITLAGESGVAKVKIDGATGDVLDYYVVVSPGRAGELVLERYPGYTIKNISEENDNYVVEIEDNEREVKVFISKDGKMLKEKDRVLKRELAEKIAEEEAKKIDPEAKVEPLVLSDNWTAEFTGVTKVGTLTLERSTGQVLKVEARFTERALEDLYHRHLRGKYGEDNLNTERITHYKDRGYMNIKVSGGEYIYYARLDTKTGEILEEDRVPKKGLTARIKQMQLEGKYK
ncbi:restriction endonuclease [Thermococcus waiotapuensis]|uniref:Restriction endonuclease n=1 Tax=Thermococcus waiotapuensis TaxID=90909 RepID=A0AAE4NSV9_9EURY|nr:restriction endonuclease [Thermococcus waiotapuensis]MDV3103723.1 restriction endonuclease [Thermococcus waiotapuensis]